MSKKIFYKKIIIINILLCIIYFIIIGIIPYYMVDEEKVFFLSQITNLSYIMIIFCVVDMKMENVNNFGNI